MSRQSGRWRLFAALKRQLTDTAAHRATGKRVALTAWFREEQSAVPIGNMAGRPAFAQSTPRPATHPGRPLGHAAKDFQAVARALLTDQEKQFLGFALREFQTCVHPAPPASAFAVDRLGRQATAGRGFAHNLTCRPSRLACLCATRYKSVARLIASLEVRGA